MEKAALSFDKRRHPRVQVELPVKYKLINQSEEALQLQQHRRSHRQGASRDVSVEGLCLMTEQTLEKGDILKIEVQLPEEPHPVRAFSEVVWTAESESGEPKHVSGIYFMALRDEDAERMQGYVRRVLGE